MASVLCPWQECMQMDPNTRHTVTQVGENAADDTDLLLTESLSPWQEIAQMDFIIKLTMTCVGENAT